MNEHKRTRHVEKAERFRSHTYKGGQEMKSFLPENGGFEPSLDMNTLPLKLSQQQQNEPILCNLK